MRSYKVIIMGCLILCCSTLNALAEIWQIAPPPYAITRDGQDGEITFSNGIRSESKDFSWTLHIPPGNRIDFLPATVSGVKAIFSHPSPSGGQLIQENLYPNTDYLNLGGLVDVLSNGMVRVRNGNPNASTFYFGTHTLVHIGSSATTLVLGNGPAPTSQRPLVPLLSVPNPAVKNALVSALTSFGFNSTQLAAVRTNYISSSNVQDFFNNSTNPPFFYSQTTTSSESPTNPLFSCEGEPCCCLNESEWRGCTWDQNDPAHRRKTMVVLLPGLNRTSDQSPVKERFEEIKGNSCVNLFTYNYSSNDCLTTQVDQFDRFMSYLANQCDYCKILIFGNSAGGIISQRWLVDRGQFYYGDRQIHLETFGSPFQGSSPTSPWNPAAGCLTNEISTGASILDQPGFTLYGDNHSITHYTHPDDPYISVLGFFFGITQASQTSQLHSDPDLESENVTEILNPMAQHGTNMLLDGFGKIPNCKCCSSGVTCPVNGAVCDIRPGVQGLCSDNCCRLGFGSGSGRGGVAPPPPAPGGGASHGTGPISPQGGCRKINNARGQWTGMCGGRCDNPHEICVPATYSEECICVRPREPNGGVHP